MTHIYYLLLTSDSMAQLLQSMAQLICNQKRYQKMYKQLFPTQSIQDNICFCEDLVTKPTCWEL